MILVRGRLNTDFFTSVQFSVLEIVSVKGIILCGLSSAALDTQFGEEGQGLSSPSVIPILMGRCPVQANRGIMIINKIMLDKGCMQGMIVRIL